MKNNNDDINPFTGMSNVKSMQLQHSWNHKLKSEFNIDFSNISNVDQKFTKSCLSLPENSENNNIIKYEQMCPSSIHFGFTIKI